MAINMPLLLNLQKKQKAEKKSDAVFPLPLFLRSSLDIKLIIFFKKRKLSTFTFYVIQDQSIFVNTTKEHHPNQYLNSRDFKNQLFRLYYLGINLKLYHSMARANLNKVKYLSHDKYYRNIKLQNLQQFKYPLSDPILLKQQKLVFVMNFSNLFRQALAIL